LNFDFYKTQIQGSNVSIHQKKQNLPNPYLDLDFPFVLEFDVESSQLFQKKPENFNGKVKNKRNIQIPKFQRASSSQPSFPIGHWLYSIPYSISESDKKTRRRGLSPFGAQTRHLRVAFRSAYSSAQVWIAQLTLPFRAFPWVLTQSPPQLHPKTDAAS
jgi:hypothetical protein